MRKFITTLLLLMLVVGSLCFRDVFAAATTVSSITINSAPAGPGGYVIGEPVTALVTFSAAEVVTGTPTLTLNIGGVSRVASYISGSTTTQLTFRYYIVPGDVDTNGISITANSLSINGGTSTITNGGTAATITHSALTDQSADKVAGIISIVISSTPASASTYGIGETVEATVTFTENQTVTGTPSLKLNIGGYSRSAQYTSGSGYANLKFEYIVVNGDLDTNGISVDASDLIKGTNALTLNGGKIQGYNTTDTTLTYSGTANDSGDKVSTTGVATGVIASGISISSAPVDGVAYRRGDTIEATVVFSNPVVVTPGVGGTTVPTLSLNINGTQKLATYTSGSYSNSLVFSYTILATDTLVDNTGIGIDANKIANNGTTTLSTIKNGNTNATITHSAVADSSTDKVDTTGIATTISAIDITSVPADSAGYKSGEMIYATVTFSNVERVVVGATPMTLGLSVGTNTRQASYLSGSDTNKLIFVYQVVSTDADADGINVTANPITLNTSTIKNGITTATTTPRVAGSANPAAKVISGANAGVATQVSAITTITTTAPIHNSTYTYAAGEVISATVSFVNTSGGAAANENVNTTGGTPTLSLDIGGNIRTATYASGSGSDKLVFNYTVVTGDNDTTGGITVVNNSLATNGGKIENGTATAAPVAATITHAVFTANTQKVVTIVDNTAPVFRSALAAGSTITLTYDESGSGLNAAIVPIPGDFTFSRNGGAGSQLSVTSVVIDHSAQTVSLGLNGLINLSDTNLRISYTPGSNKIQDVAGNIVAALSNVYIPTTMPRFDVQTNTLKFNSPSLKAGTGLAVNSKILFSNVITVDGQSIDAIVTIKAATLGTTLSGTDSIAGTKESTNLKALSGFDTNWFTLDASIADVAGDITVDFEFIKSNTYGTMPTYSTGADVILENVVVNSYDLDGTQANATSYQYQEFGGFATYTVASNSNLTQTQHTGYTHFQTTRGLNETNGPGTYLGDQLRVMALYEAIHTFSIKTGSLNTTGSAGTAYYYLDFSKGPNWAIAATPTYKIPTVNSRVTNDKTPDLTGTFVGTVGYSSDQAYQFSIKVNGITYTANTRSVAGNTVTLTDSLTVPELTGSFNTQTGLGTWALTIPPANELPYATYDVTATVNYGPSLAAINKFTTDDTTNELVISAAGTDTTAPTLTSIQRLSPLGEVITPAALAIQTYVDFNVTFSEAVTNVDTTDFAITGVGSTGSTLSSVTQSGTNTYTVRISNIPTDNAGVLDLNLLATTDIIDIAGNLLDKTNDGANPSDPLPLDPVEGVVPTSRIDETYNISDLAYDYSDAPNTTISGTAYSYGNPSHLHTSASIFLGTTAPDADTTSATWQTQTTADGDDGAGGDEGITQLLNSGASSFPALTTTDTSYSLTLKCAGIGITVSGWIDFNKNKSFESTEGAQNTCSGTITTLTWAVPPLTTGDTYARFRIATIPITLDSPSSSAADGEVEDYKLPITLGVITNYDYSDAPTSYGSPSHIKPTTPTIYLGVMAPDNEAAPATPLDGTGDDTTEIDDEDGVTLSNGFAVGGTVTVPVVIVGSGNLNLNAWFDWNKDGDFADTGEQMADDLPVTAGTTNLSINIPNTATTGASYARFRLCSTAGNCNTATGTGATDGEIEDYPFTIRPGIKIIKTLSPTADTDKFNLTVSGGNPTGGTNPTSNAGHNGTTGFVAVDADAVGGITVQETGNSTNLANYTTDLNCVYGSGGAVTLTSPDLLNTTTRQASFTAPTSGSVGTAAQIICTFANSKIPTVKVQKITTGGTGTFTFTQTNLASNPVDITTTATSTATPASPTAINVTTVDTEVTITEATGASHTLSTAYCIDANSAVTGNTGTFGTLATNVLTIPAVNVKAGADITCTFTNAIIAAPSQTLQLKKTWVNANIGDTVILTKNGAHVLNSVANTVSETDDGPVQTINTNDVITLNEYFQVGMPSQYQDIVSTIGCTNNGSNITPDLTGTNHNILTILDTYGTVVCTFTNTRIQAITITGTVFEDSGVNLNAIANDGIQLGEEGGIYGATVKLTNCGSTVYSTTTTDVLGNYTLSAATAPTGDICVVETNLSGYISTGGNISDNTVIDYNRTEDRIKFAFTAGNSYSDINFGDVITNAFNPNNIGNGNPGSVVFYPHNFISMSDGTVSFTTSRISSPSALNWSEVIYLDGGSGTNSNDCNGVLDSGELRIAEGDLITRTVDSTLCILVKEFIPASAHSGAMNVVTVTANFTYTGSTPLPELTATPLIVTDTTTAGTATGGVITLHKAVDKSTTLPGEILTYTITYSNVGATPISNIVISDAVLPYTTLKEWCCAVLGVTSCTLGTVTDVNCKTTCTNGTTPIDCATGLDSNTGLKWTFDGALAPGASGNVKYSVRVAQ